MRFSLTQKVFIGSLVSSLIVIGLTVVTLMSYFSFFYEKDKIRGVVNNINAFEADYESSDWDRRELYQQIIEFNNQNNLDMWVYDYTGAGSLGSVYSGLEQVISASDTYYYVEYYLEGLYFYSILDAREYRKLQSEGIIKVGQSIQLQGYTDNYSFILAETIGDFPLKSFDVYMDAISHDSLSPFDAQVTILKATEIHGTTIMMEEITGTYENRHIRPSESDVPSTGETVKFKQNENLDSPISSLEENAFLSSALTEVPFDELMTSDLLIEKSFSYKEDILDGVTYTKMAMPYTEYSNVSFSKLLFRDSGIQEIYVNLSLHSVHEINDILMIYVPWFILAAIILSALLAYVYSKFVADPILSIADAARRMSLQDFEVTLDTDRKDELGTLAASLKRMSEDLRKALESLVRQNAQLEHDFNIKSTEEEARKAFIANASHELKTPIGVIKSYTEAILDGVKVEKQSYYLSVIADETKHMENLVKEMTLLSRLEGEISYRQEPVDLDALMPVLVNNLQTKLEARSVKAEIKPDLGTVVGDRDKLCQVFTNLIDNAAKYSNENSVLRIESIHTGDHIELFFQNDCPHFTEEELSKVWSRFYKVDVSHNRSIEGSGLGLSIVKSILERHDSDFGVYNTRNGVCFHMTFKVYDGNIQR